VEVGPGLGILTRALARRASQVVAVELDASLADALRQEMAAFPGVRVVQGDILKMSPDSLVDGASYKVVANIPYYITSPILHHFLGSGHCPTLMVVMVQREVAEAIAAPPGKLGVLGISVQLYARPKVVTRVPAGSFYPAPRVESALLRLDVLPRPPVAVEPEDFLRLVGAGFAAPRKQLRNSLAQGLGVEPGLVVEALLRAGISPERRPQTLSLEEWARLWDCLGQRRG
jgi:16S rRNA (adenine1518-N6/adenine1519-N6)-dimethyltransferase